MILLITLAACNNDAATEKKETKDSVKIEEVKPEPEIKEPSKPVDSAVSKEYSNARFRKVTVQKVGENSYRVRGQGQIFEANFNWVIEDGHEELAKGYQMTDAGAPEWGNFDFTVKASKKRENSTLHLIIFETSAEDGRRVHELMIKLNG